MQPIFGFILFFAASLVVSVIASKRGRSGWLAMGVCLAAGFGLVVLASSAGAGGIGAALAGFMAPVGALVWALSASSSQDLAVKNGEHGDFKKCPACAEPIRKEAIKCRHCGEAVTSTVARTNWQ